MKTIGLIGGTGWISTVEYYRIINQEVSQRLGGANAARLILYSFNYADIDRLNAVSDYHGVMALVKEAAMKLEQAGAQCLALCANTLHFYATELENSIHVPLVHIARATAEEIRNDRIGTVGLLGTLITMEKEFYRQTLMEAGIEVLIPDRPEREFIHDAIRNEFLHAVFSGKTRHRFITIIGNLVQRGAQGIVLGCTEIPLLIRQEHVSIPLFNTLEIHARAIAMHSIKEDLSIHQQG